MEIKARAKAVWGWVSAFAANHWPIVLSVSLNVGALSALAVGFWWIAPAYGLIVPAGVLVLWRFIEYLAPLLMRGANDDA